MATLDCRDISLRIKEESSSRQQREHSLYSTVNSRLARLQGASKWYVNHGELTLGPAIPPRTPQTPLKHYPRADALGKSDATILPSWRIDITSRHHRVPVARARARSSSHICIPTTIGYVCMHSNLHFVAAYLHDRTPLSTGFSVFFPVFLFLFFPISFFFLFPLVLFWLFVLEVKKLAHA